MRVLFERKNYFFSDVRRHISKLWGAVELIFGCSVVLLSRTKPSKDSFRALCIFEICPQTFYFASPHPSCESVIREEKHIFFWNVRGHISKLWRAMQLIFGCLAVLLSRTKPPKDSFRALSNFEICPPTFYFASPRPCCDGVIREEKFFFFKYHGHISKLSGALPLLFGCSAVLLSRTNQKRTASELYPTLRYAIGHFI